MLAAVLFVAASIACSPTFNWRTVRLDSGLQAVLPCKPDRATRSVPLGGRPTALRMQGCEAGGVTFALSEAPGFAPEQAHAVLAGWQQASLAGMRGQVQGTTSFVVAGLPPAMQVSAQGADAQGRVVHSRAVYLAHGGTLVQAIVIGTRMPDEAAETFFAGLRLP